MSYIFEDPVIVSIFSFRFIRRTMPKTDLNIRGGGGGVEGGIG